MSHALAALAARHRSHDLRLVGTEGRRWMRRFSALMTVLGLGLMVGMASARAAEVSPFTQAEFAAAQARDRPILVAIQAPWCPTCAAQRPILQQIEAEGAYKNLRVLLVDFDTQKDVVREMHATMQSTLVVFHGGKEVARSVGDTNPETIKATVARSLI
jgi:thiol-disulfide isomerase/thioredoxin